ncbi:MAG: 2-aminoethylphosphonate--pyruvate transaminase, partial [Oscillospiraceae bacterium]|nr:2-aminoethylphosphonate--pyruvate transaminase [Oscillospiraceae bacterium]
DKRIKGRPYPYMIWSNLMQFGIIDPREALKVGDTLADIEEGINANCWTAGVIMGSSELGLCRDEVEAMTESELFERKKQVHAAYYQAGADYIIEDMNQLPGVIADINQRLAMATTRKLLTPGPLTTRYSVKHAMLTDHCTWDDEYKAITASIANDLTKIAVGDESSEYVTILLQGSGSYAVEAMINCLNDKDDRILFLVNGEYGRRMVRMADNAGCSYELLNFEDTEAIDCKIVDNTLRNNPGINSVIFVHCETTTGIINPLKDIARLAKSYGKKVFVDAMSSFGAYEIDMKAFRIDGLASSANKCLEGLPGLSFVIVDRQIIEQSKGKATSLCLDLYEQYRSLYEEGGKFRFTSPTNILLALRQAIDEYMKEGGLPARRARYIKNHTTLVEELRKLDISPLIAADIQSYIITTFELKDIEFTSFYEMLKNNGFIIYPGKLTTVPTFRIGNIGDVYPSDMKRLAEVIGDYLSSFAIRCYYSDPSV